jgi:hypothetical protein
MAELNLAPREIVVRKTGDVWYLESGHRLLDPPARLGDLFRRAAARAPDRIFLIERRDNALRRGP